MFEFKKSCILFLLLGVFFVFDASAKEGDDKHENKKAEIRPNEKEGCTKADSLEVREERAILKDSLDHGRNSAPSSMSSMSYNILFQVIYRYSFKEIFDSPAASDIVTN